jgi:hypothetical protein
MRIHREETTMLTIEETKVLAYLRGHPFASAAEVARACLPGASPDWVARVVANLDWLGHLTTYQGPDGRLAAVQITEKGLGQAGGQPCRIPRR